MKSIISIIISIIAKIIFKFYSKDNNDIESVWGLVTQSNLINSLGDKIVAQLPDEIPEIFFDPEMG